MPKTSAAVPDCQRLVVAIKSCGSSITSATVLSVTPATSSAVSIIPSDSALSMSSSMSLPLHVLWACIAVSVGEADNLAELSARLYSVAGTAVFSPIGSLSSSSSSPPKKSKSKNESSFSSFGSVSRIVLYAKDSEEVSSEDRTGSFLAYASV